MPRHLDPPGLPGLLAVFEPATSQWRHLCIRCEWWMLTDAEITELPASLAEEHLRSPHPTDSVGRPHGGAFPPPIAVDEGPQTPAHRN